MFLVYSLLQPKKHKAPDMSQKAAEEIEAYKSLAHRLIDLLRGGHKATARSHINTILMLWHNNKQVGNHATRCSDRVRHLVYRHSRSTRAQQVRDTRFTTAMAGVRSGDNQHVTDLHPDYTFSGDLDDDANTDHLLAGTQRLLPTTII
jgi:hypothetical protein